MASPSSTLWSWSYESENIFGRFLRALTPTGSDHVDELLECHPYLGVGAFKPGSCQ